MNSVQTWAQEEVKKLMPGGFLEDEDIKQLVSNLVQLDSVSINEEISGLLDFSKKEVKKFITDFIQRVENQRKYEEHSKEVQKKADKLAKQGKNSQKTSVSVRDFSKVKQAGRNICYCMCTMHPLVNNCVACGKIVCEQEGEGPCLFCGNWVDRESTYDLNEIGDEEQDGDSNHALALHYQTALQHRDKLIEYDVNAAKRLGVIDERQDWYELSNNTWLNKDQRSYAKQMEEIEKKRADIIDKTISVNINLETGTVTQNKEEDDLFTYAQQNEDVNRFLQD
jgi:hypothetical protein